jgi:8-oxo-dGTP diphosphatase
MKREPLVQNSILPEFPRPLTTVDVVIFTLLNDQLQVLLVKRPEDSAEPFPNAWALPGGFVDVDKDRSLEICARRKLLEKTGVKAPYLEQLGSWGDAKRDPRGWSATHAWFALIPSESMKLRQGGNAQDVHWHPVELLPKNADIAFDHLTILHSAIDRLRSKVEYTSLPAFMLPEPFTLPQLQRVYEVVLGRPLDKSGFRTRALAATFLVETGYMDVGAPWQAMGYRLSDRVVPTFFPRTFSGRN